MHFNLEALTIRSSPPGISKCHPTSVKLLSRSTYPRPLALLPNEAEWCSFITQKVQQKSKVTGIKFLEGKPGFSKTKHWFSRKQKTNFLGVEACFQDKSKSLIVMLNNNGLQTPHVWRPNFSKMNLCSSQKQVSTCAHFRRLTQKF